MISSPFSLYFQPLTIPSLLGSIHGVVCAIILTFFFIRLYHEKWRWWHSVGMCLVYLVYYLYYGTVAWFIVYYPLYPMMGAGGLPSDYFKVCGWFAALIGWIVAGITFGFLAKGPVTEDAILGVIWLFGTGPILIAMCMFLGIALLGGIGWFVFHYYLFTIAVAWLCLVAMISITIAKKIYGTEDYEVLPRGSAPGRAAGIGIG